MGNSILWALPQSLYIDLEYKVFMGDRDGGHEEGELWFKLVSTDSHWYKTSTNQFNHNNWIFLAFTELKLVGIALTC